MSGVGQPVKHQALYYRAADIYYIFKPCLVSVGSKGKQKMRKETLHQVFIPVLFIFGTIFWKEYTFYKLVIGSMWPKCWEVYLYVHYFNFMTSFNNIYATSQIGWKVCNIEITNYWPTLIIKTQGTILGKSGHAWLCQIKTLGFYSYNIFICFIISFLYLSWDIFGWVILELDCCIIRVYYYRIKNREYSSPESYLFWVADIIKTYVGHFHLKLTL